MRFSLHRKRGRFSIKPVFGWVRSHKILILGVVLIGVAAWQFNSHFTVSPRSKSKSELKARQAQRQEARKTAQNSANKNSSQVQGTNTAAQNASGHSRPARRCGSFDEPTLPPVSVKVTKIDTKNKEITLDVGTAEPHRPVNPTYKWDEEPKVFDADCKPIKLSDIKENTTVTLFISHDDKLLAIGKNRE